MAEEAQQTKGSGAPPEEHGGKRKKRRRRRRKKNNASASPKDGANRHGGPTWGDNVLIASDPNSKAAVGRKKGRRQVDLSEPNISLPASGRNPRPKRGSRSKRDAPSNASSRRRRLNRMQLEELTAYLKAMPEPLLAALYKGLGGQPNRINNAERILQLTTRAIAQGSRLSSLLKQLHERDRKALAGLLQAGGIAHAAELHRELGLSYGGQERDWQRTMLVLSNRGLVMASPEQDGQFFYIIPDVIIDALIEVLSDELVLPTFSHADVRVMDARPFCPPLNFSVTSLATYIDQNAPRLTQRHEIYRHDQEQMDAFFSQVWEADSELFSFHLDFLMMHGMVELRGEYLSLNREVMEEWLQLESEDQRDLLFRALNKRFFMAEWVLWSIFAANKNTADDPHGGWVAERPLVAMYRRWKRGEDWRERYQRGAFSNTRTHERESYSFAPLVRCGILELGQWGQEKFYRLSPRGRQLLSPPDDDGFQQFYLTPSFEIMAPAGLAPILLFRIGELADLVGCDRANTYKITEIHIEQALDRGWRRDDVLQFLRDNSQIGLPENVEHTLKGWIGNRGDVEFHDLMLMTVHRSQIRKLESNRRLKPFLLHRFAPGMYAIDRRRHGEILAALRDSSFAPAREIRNYPGDPEQVEARRNLHRLVAEARESVLDPVNRGQHLVDPSVLQAVPGTATAAAPVADNDMPPMVTTSEARTLIDRAMSTDCDLEMVYVGKNGQRINLRIEAHRFAFKADAPVLVGMDREKKALRTFIIDRIERLRLMGTP